MHLTDIDTNTHPAPSLFWGNLLFIFSAVVFDFLGEISADDVYKWSYRAIAIVSLIALAYLNVSRAIERFKGKKR